VDLTVESSQDNASIKARFHQLATRREPFLRRARASSQLTLPNLIPPDGHADSTELPTPWQSVGSRGVNHLASKLLLSLLPPNQPFFRFSLDPYVLDTLANGDDSQKSEIQTAFSRIETSIMSIVDSEGYRTSAFESLKHLLVGGNALLYDDARSPGFRVFHLSRYVVQRDSAGNVFELIVKEDIPLADVPEEARELAAQEAAKQKTDSVELYTRVSKNPEGAKWTATQEVAGQALSNTDTYPDKKNPWLALRWTRIDGEDYGRGLIEEYAGDLNSLEGLTRVLVEGSAIAAKTLFLVNPSGYTKPEDVANAANGDAISGNEADVGVLTTDKNADFAVAYQMVSQLTERLSQAFLLHRVRDAERVTAEEVRFNANELESSLGGVYSILAQEFQLPLIHRIMARLTAEKKIPTLPDSVHPVIVTGVDALGRFHELSKLNSFAQTMTQYYGPEVVAQWTKPDQMAQVVAASLGLDITPVWKTPEEIQQEQQAQQGQQLLQSPLAAKVADGVIQNAAKNAEEPEGE